MSQAATANQINYDLGPDFTLIDAYDPEYLEEVEDVDLMTTEARQALNARMAEWWEV